MEATPAASCEKQLVTAYPEPPARVTTVGISLVIPAWNEEATIVQAVREASRALSALVDQFEIIVVDDGSNDRTFEFASVEADGDASIRVVRHDQNRGYGAALRTGFEAARFELISFTDADCQFDLTDLEPMLTLASRYDIVSGYRVNRQDSWLRCFYSWGYNTIVQSLLGTAVRDVDCALKVFHRSTLQSILPTSRNYFANTEMFAKARAMNLSIVETGVGHRARAGGVSKVSVREIPRILRLLLPFWWTDTLFAGKELRDGSSSQNSWKWLLLVAVVVAAVIFPKLSYPLIEPDEGRYAEISREMVATGDWIVPKYQSTPYLDKPPLLYWLCAASYQLFGPTDWAARLVPAVSAWLSILLTFSFGRRLLDARAALIGSFALATNLAFAGCGRFLILDSLLTLCVVLSLFAAYEATRRDRFDWRWWIISAVACGLGILAKGPVALVLLVPPVVGQAWLARQQVRPRVRNWAVLVAVVCLINAPWYVAIALRNPEFISSFFWENNVSRFLNGAQHPHGVWYYVPVTFLGWMPWGLLLIPLCGFLFSRSTSLRNQRPAALGFLVLWAGWCLVFFTLSRGKLAPYILPAFPAMALLLGSFVDSILQQTSNATALQRMGTAMFRRGVDLLCVLGIVIVAVATTLHWMSPVEAVVGTIFWGLAAVTLRSRRQRLSLAMVIGICGVLGFANVVQSVHVLLPGWARQHSALPTARVAVMGELRDTSNAVACYGQDWGSVSFYLDRDDVQNFSSRKPENLVRFIEQRRQAYLIIDHSIKLADVQRLLPADATMSTVSAEPRTTIVFVNRTEPPESRAAVVGRYGAKFESPVFQR